MTLQSVADQFGFYSRLSAANTAQSALQVGVDWARSALQTDFAWSATIHDEILVFAAGSGLQQSRWTTAWTLPLDVSITRRALEKGQVQSVRNFKHVANRFNPSKTIADDEGMHSVLVAPVLGSMDQWIGGLYVAMRSHRNFSSLEENFLLQIAAQVGARYVAIETLDDLYAQMRRAVRREADSLTLVAGISLAGTRLDALRLLCGQYQVGLVVTDLGGHQLLDVNGVGDHVTYQELRVGETVLGQVHIYSSEPVDDERMGGLRHGLLVLGLRILHEQTLAARQESLAGRLFDDIIAGRLSGDIIMDRLARDGFKLRPPFVMAILKSAASHTNDDVVVPIDALRRTFLGGMIQHHQGGLGMLLPCPEGDVHKLRTRIMSCLMTAGKAGQNAVVGLSSMAETFETTDGLWREAVAACSANFGESGPVVSAFADSGAAGLIERVGADLLGKDFVEGLLGPIIESDEENDTQYIATLRALVLTGGRIDQAAKQLHVHVNTLRYRLDRMSQMYGIDYRNNDSRFEVELAIRLHIAATRPATGLST